MEGFHPLASLMEFYLEIGLKYKYSTLNLFLSLNTVSKSSSMSLSLPEVVSSLNQPRMRVYISQADPEVYKRI